MELNKKYPAKEPLTKSDIFLIVIWIIVGLALSIWPAILKISNITWESSQIGSDISNLINQPQEYNKNINNSEISQNQKDGFYRFQWWYYWGSEAYKYQLNYFNPETNNENKHPKDNEKILLSTKDYKRLKDLYQYKDSIYFNLKFKNWKISKRSIYDSIYKKELGELTADEIKKEFDPESKYPTKEIKLNGNIKISEYEENTVYKLIVPAWENGNIKITNDTNTEILIFTKGADFISNKYYKGEIIKKNNNIWFWWGYSSVEQTYNFYFKKATTEEKIYYSETEKLSKEEFNKKIVVMAEDRYYNDYWKDLYATLIDDQYIWDDPYETKIVKDWGLLEIPDDIDFIYITDHEPKQEEFPRYEEYNQYAQHYVQEGTEWTSWTVEEL